MPAPQTHQNQPYVLSTPAIAPAPVDQGFAAACGAPQAPMGGPFMNVPTMAEAAAQANGQKHQQPGTGHFQTIVPLMPVMPQRAPQVSQP